MNEKIVQCFILSGRECRSRRFRLILISTTKLGLLLETVIIIGRNRFINQINISVSNGELTKISSNIKNIIILKIFILSLKGKLVEKRIITIDFESTF
jgi:hypothetical protein